MTPLIRLFFLPIMLAAGALTVILMVALTTPLALWHIYRERQFRQSDLTRVRAWRENFLRACSLSSKYQKDSSVN